MGHPRSMVGCEWLSQLCAIDAPNRAHLDKPPDLFICMPSTHHLSQAEGLIGQSESLLISRYIENKVE